MSNTEQEIISILKGMYDNINNGEVPEHDAMTDAIDLIKQEVGFSN